MRLNRVCWLLIIAVLSLLIPVSHGQDDAAAWTVDSEYWYVLEINSVRAGWQSVMTETNGEQWRTTSASELNISRGAASASVTSRSEMVETTDGKPVSMRSEQKMSTEKSVTRWEFADHAVRQIVESNGREIVKTLPMPEKPWVTPVAANEYWLRKAAEDAQTIFTRVLMPDNGLTPVDVSYERGGTVEVEYQGESVIATVWKTSTSMLPDVFATEHYTPDGTLVYSEAGLPFGNVVTRLTTKQLARAESGPGPEIMMSTFVPVNEPIRNVMRSKSATFRLRTNDGRAMELPAAGAQQVESDGRDMIVRVDMNAPGVATDEERADATYLESSGAIDPEDSLIIKLAANATRRSGENVAAKSEALRKLVNRHISRKGMATAFATASETARTRTGDCSEHAVLLAALLRAQDIPARIATGLVYVDRFEGQRNVFGWHMWTQALIDGKWIDLDATLPVPYHAGHVLTGVSALSDETPASEMNSILTLIGNLEIEVVDVSD